MQRAKKFTLLALSALVMTACGGSGGGGSDESKTEVNPQTTVENTQVTPAETAQPATSTEPVQSTTQPVAQSEPSSSVKQLTAEYFITTPTSISALKNSTSTDANQIVVDGVTLSLVPNLTGISGNNVNIITNFIGDGDRLISQKTDFVKYGIVRKNADDFVVFVQGQRTDASAVPTSGTAYYEGPAMIVLKERETVDGRANSIIQNTSYTSKFNVDFGQKSLNAKFERPEHSVSVDAKINGNEFSGSDSVLSVKGHFYGDNAEELGGTFENSKQIGAFGAKKQ